MKINNLKINPKKVLAAAGLSLVLSMNPGLSAIAAPAPIDRETTEEQTNGHVEPGYGIELQGVLRIKFDTNEIYLDNHLSEENLSHVKEIDISYTDGIDYSYITRMNHLKSLTISYHDSTADLSCLNGILSDESMNITLRPYDYSDGITNFTEQTAGFLKTIPSINNLTVGYQSMRGDAVSFVINQKCLEELDNVDTLDLYINPESNYNYKDLSNYKNVRLHGKPFDVIMFINMDQINELKNSGTNVEYDQIDTLNNIDWCLKNNVIEQLNVPENATDKEKLDAIIEFVLLNFNYDPKVIEAFETGKSDELDIEEYYGNGFLTAAFVNPQAIICGNYTALVASLCNYYDIDAYTVVSMDHAFNEVVLDEKPYVLDTTWMDSSYVADKTAADVFKNDEQDLYNIPYYLSDPNELYDLVWYDSHCPWVTQNDYYVDTYDFSEMYEYFNSIVPLPEETVKSL